VPMYFVHRDGRYIDVAGRSFRDFMLGRVPELVGMQATVGDFADHMTTVFTDVRLKRFLEMRGSDAGRPDMMLAQSGLWVGLLYDGAALAAAEALVRPWTWEEVTGLRAAVPRLGLDAPFAPCHLRVALKEVVAIARDGLGARFVNRIAAQDEREFLAPLLEIAFDGKPTQAQHWLQKYAGVWRHNVSHIFAESAI